jgi:sodium transport system ATP-binding protein
MIDMQQMSKVFPLSKKLQAKTGKPSVRAVDSLTLSIPKGEIFGLLGSNGAGKTTSLRVLATMLTPSEGTAMVGGYDIRKEPAAVRRSIGLLFGGDTGLYDRLTAFENIQFFARLNDIPDAESSARIRELAEMFRFSEFLDRQAGKLSKGTRQKVSFARCIIHDPDIMLFDEPTTGLDVTAKREVEDFILQCRDNKKTIILSDHTLSVVERLCSRIGILEEGKLLAVGSIEELCEKHNCESLEDVFFQFAGVENEK